MSNDYKREAAHQADLDYVANFLHYAGDRKDDLTREQAQLAFCLGDGFGAGLTPGELSEINSGWDWSHVRDSSAKAMADIAHLIRGFVDEKDSAL